MPEQFGKVEMQIGGSEKLQRKLIVEWPKKEDLFFNRDKYIRDNMEKMEVELKRDYVMEDKVEIEQLAKIILSAKFMFVEMCKISPIPLEQTFTIIDSFDYRENGALMGVNPGKVDECVVFVDSFWQQMNNGLQNLDIKAMGGAVHEFAHMIYKQESNLYKQPKKIAGWQEGERRMMTSENETDAYLAVDLEIRARIWQLSFLKRYFPDSEDVKIVEKQLELGKKVRENRRKVFATSLV